MNSHMHCASAYSKGIVDYVNRAYVKVDLSINISRQLHLVLDVSHLILTYRCSVARKGAINDDAL